LGRRNKTVFAIKTDPCPPILNKDNKPYAEVNSAISSIKYS
jgi:hypothetical protein